MAPYSPPPATFYPESMKKQIQKEKIWLAGKVAIESGVVETHRTEYYITIIDRECEQLFLYLEYVVW